MKTVFTEQDIMHFRKAFAQRGIDWGKVQFEIDFSFERYIVQYFFATQGKAEMPKKGLLFTGITGSGKTLLLKTFCKFFQLKTTTFEQVAERMKAVGIEETRRFLNTPFSNWGSGDFDLFIDELAEAEKHEILDYGQRINTAEKALYARYELFNEIGALTFLTTNLTPENIVREYGDRIFSRLRKMCIFVPMANHDWRLE